ncbi:hypothetical protein QE152_g7432 [Popillia japonica]|uniref:Uncharacterized protein n=1 Tax=Popillia japonica TaxID=7064 RepID=A0AAW1MEU2_POPJA
MNRIKVYVPRMWYDLQYIAQIYGMYFKPFRKWPAVTEGEEKEEEEGEEEEKAMGEDRERPLPFCLDFIFNVSCDQIIIEASYPFLPSCPDICYRYPI